MHALKQMFSRNINRVKNTSYAYFSSYGNHNLSSVDAVGGTTDAGGAGTVFGQQLSHRSLLKVSGPDSWNLLQNLISNDMHCLDRDCNALSALILNVQGRVLYDCILYNISNKSDTYTYLVEVESSVVQDVLTLFKRYKIRKKVHVVDASSDLKPWALLPSTDDTLTKCIVHLTHPDRVVSCNEDPRLSTFGCRIILKEGATAQDVVEKCISLTDINEYHTRRFRLCIPEGTNDLPPGNCFPLESNAVYLNSVSFNKGCYIGQELTARTHHTGVTRKRLMPLVFSSDQTTSLRPDDAIINEKSKKIGKFRDAIGKYGLGLLREAEANGTLTVQSSKGTTNELCSTHRPSWWPDES